MNFSPSFSEDVFKNAGHFFRVDDLNCAESVLKAILVSAQAPCTPEMLALAKGFGRGMNAGCACGALAGGVMALGSLLGGRSKEADKLCKALTQRYHDAFKQANGATCCRVLHRGLAFGTTEQLAACAKRTENAARILAQILAGAAAEINSLGIC